MNEYINLILSKMNNNFFHNKRIFMKYFTSLNYCDIFGNSLLHIVIMGTGSEDEKKLAIATLLQNKVNPNERDSQGNTFIHLAIKKKMSLDFICNILNEACSYGFNINTCNEYGRNIFQEAILSMDSYNELLAFMIYLKTNYSYFDEITEQEYFNYIKKRQEEDKKQLSDQMDNLKSSLDDNIIISNKEKCVDNRERNVNEINNQSTVVRKYGQILNDKDFSSNPAVGRSEEIFKIIISMAQDKKLPLLVGPSGCGKTAIIEGLAYNIKMGQVPEFLKDKLIFEVSVFSAIAGTKYRGDLENNMKEILDFCYQNNMILFIDEFSLINSYGVNDDKKTDISAIIQNYIDRYNLKVIGAMTDYEYDMYMSVSPLKRRFTKINISEPNRDVLYNIVVSSFNSFSQKRNISLSDDISQYIDEIINILIDLTDEKRRIQEDKVCNPDLIISIIDMAFAYAIVNNDIELKIDYLTEAILGCERIYPYSKGETVNKINQLFDKKCLRREKQLVINFSDYIKR